MRDRKLAGRTMHACCLCHTNRLFTCVRGRISVGSACDMRDRKPAGRTVHACCLCHTIRLLTCVRVAAEYFVQQYAPAHHAQHAASRAGDPDTVCARL